MKLKFWGVRGSLPAPVSPYEIEAKIKAALQLAAERNVPLQDREALESFARVLPLDIESTVGGNTTCITLETDEQLIIFDAGSGMRNLGRELMKREFGQGNGHAALFFTHTHWDHIQGFPFFMPLFVPGNRFDIYHIHDYVPRVLANQMSAEVYPIDFHQLPAEINFHQIKPDQVMSLDNLQISHIELNHPGKAYSYRVDDGEYTFVLATDGEYKQLGTSHTRRYIDFYQEADVLIFDAQFSVREAIIKEDWGHSSALVGTDIARAARAKRLFLFHHDPTSTDAEILTARNQAREYAAQQTSSPTLKIDVAQEGFELDLRQAGDFVLKEYSLDGVFCLALAGRFDAQASEIFSEYIAEIVRDGEIQKIILDMDKVESMTIAGIHALLDARRNFVSLSIVNLPETVQRVIELAETADFFAIYDSMSDVMKFSKSAPASK